MTISEPQQPLVSVLIRVCNEEHALRQLIERLHLQRIDRPFEIVVIDNESVDKSASVAREMGARVFTLPRSLFCYGRAINIGLKRCLGDLIVLLSAHACPQGEDWLDRMVHCIESEGVAAAYCRQIPGSNVSQLEAMAFKGFAEQSYRLDAEELLHRCTVGEDIYAICRFSNAAAVVWRDIALNFPFRDLPFSEDRAFVLDCMIAGHSIAYLGSASVVYQQRGAFRNFYRRGSAAQISKQLIRKLGSEATGRDLRKSFLNHNLVQRLSRSSLECIRSVVGTLPHKRSQLRGTTRYAIALCARFLGSVVGELTWNRYRETTCCDLSVLLAAERSTRPYLASDNPLVLGHLEPSAEALNETPWRRWKTFVSRADQRREFPTRDAVR